MTTPNRFGTNPLNAYHKAHPDLATELLRRVAGDLPADFESQAQAYVEQLQAEGSNIASRKAHKILLMRLVTIA